MSELLYTLHGFTGRADAWQVVAPDAAACLALIGHEPDLPVPAGWTFDREVDRIAGLVTAAGRPVHLAGYSMGGRVALGVAVRRPERVARLTLVSAHPGLVHAARTAERRASDEQWCRLLETAGIAAFVAAWEELPMWRSQSKLAAEVRERQRRARLEHSAQELAAALRALGTGAMPSLWHRLPELPMPVDWVAGGLDEKFAELAQRAAASTSGGRAVVIANAGHNVLLESPKELSRVLCAARREEREMSDITGIAQPGFEDIRHSKSSEFPRHR